MTGEDRHTSTVDGAAAFEAERAQNARNIPAHEHYYTRNGDELACYCGESVDWSDVEP